MNSWPSPCARPACLSKNDQSETPLTLQKREKPRSVSSSLELRRALVQLLAPDQPTHTSHTHKSLTSFSCNQRPRRSSIGHIDPLFPVKRRTSAFDFDFRLLVPRTSLLYFSLSKQTETQTSLVVVLPFIHIYVVFNVQPKSPANSIVEYPSAYHRSRLTFYAGRKGCIWLGSTFKKSDKTRSNPRPTTGKLKTSVLRPVPRSFYCHFTSICHWSPYSTRQTQHRGRGGCAQAIA